MADTRPELSQLMDMLGDLGTRESVPAKLQAYGESAVEPLITALHDTEEGIRQGAAWVIGRTYPGVVGAAAAPLALEPLADLLVHDDSARVRQQALHTLMVIAQSDVRVTLVEPLSAALKDAQESIRADAARWLGQIRAAQAVDALREAMENDPSEKVRGRAAYALAYIELDLATLAQSGPAGINALLTAVKDSERSVRLRAIWALGNLKAVSAARTLAGILEGTGGFQEKRMAAEALGQIGDTSVIDTLIMALQFDSHEGVRSSAAEALGMLNDWRALNVLVRSLLSDAQPNVRASTAKALEWVNDPATVEPLIEALNDSSADVRFRAAQALGSLKDTRAIDPLNALAHDPQTSKHVRDAAARALNAIHN